jgi:hypothetical protein
MTKTQFITCALLVIVAVAQALPASASSHDAWAAARLRGRQLAVASIVDSHKFSLTHRISRVRGSWCSACLAKGKDGYVPLGVPDEWASMLHKRVKKRPRLQNYILMH